jgi:hypothetical protein
MKAPMAYKPGPKLLKLTEHEFRELTEIYNAGISILRAQINGHELTAEQVGALKRSDAVHAWFPKPEAKPAPRVRPFVCIR